MFGIGLAFTVSNCESVPVQPLASVTVTVYVAAAAITTVGVSAPVFHKYPLYGPPALNTVLNPAHIEISPVILGTGLGLTMIT
jgi:hypothetical protein